MTDCSEEVNSDSEVPGKGQTGSYGQFRLCVRIRLVRYRGAPLHIAKPEHGEPTNRVCPSHEYSVYTTQAGCVKQYASRTKTSSTCRKLGDNVSVICLCLLTRFFAAFDPRLPVTTAGVGTPSAGCCGIYLGCLKACHSEPEPPRVLLGARVCESD